MLLGVTQPQITNETPSILMVFQSSRKRRGAGKQAAGSQRPQRRNNAKVNDQAALSRADRHLRVAFAAPPHAEFIGDAGCSRGARLKGHGRFVREHLRVAATSTQPLPPTNPAYGPRPL
jgi:hypothetical protein